MKESVQDRPAAVCGADRLRERALALLQKKARKAGRGAELICDESTAATSCPYCGNPTVVPNVSLTY